MQSLSSAKSALHGVETFHAIRHGHFETCEPGMLNEIRFVRNLFEDRRTAAWNPAQFRSSIRPTNPNATEPFAYLRKRHRHVNSGDSGISYLGFADGDFGRPLGFLGWYMTAPTYFTGDPDYSGFYLHHCVHYMDLVPWLMGKPLTSIAARKIEPSPGKLLLHLDLSLASEAIGTLVMGTVQARTTPMEFVQVMGDQTRIEVDNVERVAWHRDPGFKIGDVSASLAGDGDTRIWEPNLTAARNEDPKGYAALLAGFVNSLQSKPAPDLPTIADGVQAMHALEAMIRAVETGRPQTVAS